MRWGPKLGAAAGAASLVSLVLAWSSVADAAAIGDYGDAPASYGTLAEDGGPRHAATSGFSLGETVDLEEDGQPSDDADGDGTDEDGVVIPAQLVACSTVHLTVHVRNDLGVLTPRLDAWIDFDADGSFEVGERIADHTALGTGSNTVTVNVPCDTVSAVSFARFRLSEAGVPSPLGAATDGEVEDHRVLLSGLDFGDAPDPTYPTLLAANGARHRVMAGFSLGATVDSEPNGAPTNGAVGDDNAGIDDEDGVTFSGPLRACAEETVQVVLTNAAGVGTATLDAWIDFDLNGNFSHPAEQVADGLTLSAGSQDLTVSVPCDVPTGTAYARFRLSEGIDLGPTGEAPSGEVEDHAVPIQSYAAPVVADDAYAVVHDRTLETGSVLDNDDLGSLGAEAVPIVGGTTDEGGQVDLAADGTFTYTPPAGFVGNDDFTYELTDGVTTDEATVTIAVTNSPPDLPADEPAYETPFETTLEVGADDGLLAGSSDADGDVLTAAAVGATTAEGGTVEVEPDGSFTYTPPAGFSGDDTFQFTIGDGADDHMVQGAATATRTATVTVGQPSPPEEEPASEPEPPTEPPTTPPTTDPGGDPSPGVLPRTGAALVAWALTGCALVAAGLLASGRSQPGASMSRVRAWRSMSR